MDAHPARARTFGDSAAAAAAAGAPPPPPPTPLDAAAALGTTLLALLLWVAVGWLLLVAVSDVGFLQALRFAKKRCVLFREGVALPTAPSTDRPTDPSVPPILIINNDQYSPTAPPSDDAPTRIDKAAAAAEEIERLRVSCFCWTAARDGRPRRCRRLPRTANQTPPTPGTHPSNITQRAHSRHAAARRRTRSIGGGGNAGAATRPLVAAADGDGG